VSFELLPTGPADAEQINSWIAADPDHRDKPISQDYFMTGSSGSILVFKVIDMLGIVFYVRIEPAPDNQARIHMQFSPGNVAKKRVVTAILTVFPKIIALLQTKGVSAIVYESISPSLIGWLEMNFHFIRVAETDDYVLQIGPR
jgi:hypothetical protein